MSKTSEALILMARPPDNWKRPPGRPHHMAKHHQARSESLQPHTERSSRPGPELSSVEADVYVWRYTLLVVHARKEEEECHDTVSGVTGRACISHSPVPVIPEVLFFEWVHFP